MGLTSAQRGVVTLKDVLEHSLAEIAGILDMSVPSVKGALHRGRTSLRKAAQAVGASTPSLQPLKTRLLEDYVRHFSAHEFDKLRELLARDVRLDVVGVSQSRGARQVGCYFHRYNEIEDWRLRVGSVEGRSAILVFRPQDLSGPPRCFILIDGLNGEITRIRDYRHTPYTMADAEFTIQPLPASI